MKMENYDVEEFNNRLNFLKESQNWSKDKIEAFQLEELKKLLNHCSKNVPYYRNLFKKNNIKVSDIKSLSDLKKLPLLNKNTIKDNHSKFIAEDYDKNNLIYMTTGGSTGEPLKIFMDKKFKARNHANTFFYMDIAGFNPHDFRSVRLHGDALPRKVVEEKQYWTLEDNHRLIMSVYHLSKESCKEYVDKINEFEPQYIHAYPSAISLLSKYIKELGLTVKHNIDCVFCDCETLYNTQRKLIREVFNCPIYNIYGHTEGAVIAISCSESEYLHVLPQVGIFELLKQDGTPVTEEGESGEIVVTGFNNQVFPFVRYKTGDIGIFTKKSCPCSRKFILLKEIIGRVQDYVIDAKKNMIPLAPALFDYNFDWSNIDLFRVYQDRIGKLTFKFVRSRNSSETEEEIARRTVSGFERIFNYSFKIDVEFVDKLERTKIGKYRYLEQKLDIATLNTLVK